MQDYTVSARFNYRQKKVDVSAVHSGLNTSNLAWEMRSPQGAWVAGGILAAKDTLYGMTTYYGSGSFGNDIKNYGTYDVNLATNKLWYSEMYSNWNGSLPSLGGAVTAYITGSLPNIITVSRGTNSYVDVPALVYRGDTVLQAQISYTSGLNYLRLTNTTVPALTGHSFNGYIGQIISGAHSGQNFTVTSTTSSETGIFVDRVVSGYSGEIVKLMPYKMVTAYSGWGPYTGGGDLGNNGIKSEFTLDSALKRGIGSPSINMALSGYGTFDIGPSLLGSPGVSVDTMTLIYTRPGYLVDTQIGDLITYYDDPLGTNTGLILESGPHSTPGWDYVIVFPRAVGTPTTPATLYRGNRFTLYNYPEFGEEYNIYVHRYAGLLGSNTITAPTATIDVTANEFDSTYGSVGELSHFHIGPVVLSNGEYLNEQASITAPVLFLSGHITNGDVTAPSTLAVGGTYATYENAVGSNFAGKYYLDGTLTLTPTTPISFNTSETLSCRLYARYGSAIVENVVHLPVQPAV